MNQKLSVWIFDIDGTVATRGDRDPYDMERVGEDAVNRPAMTTAIALSIAAPGRVVFVTGRSDDARWRTAMWLDAHFGLHYRLHMRKQGDNRPDGVVKKEILDDLRNEFDIIAVFDDRNQTVDMWRANGIPTFQVCSRAEGDF